MKAFKDYITVDYTGTGDTQLARNSIRRKREDTTGPIGEELKKFRILTTLIDKNATSVSKRKEQIQKHATVSAPDLDTAYKKTKAYYKNKGYTVVDMTDATMKEESDLEERVVTMAQRMKMRANFRKIRGKIKLGQMRAKKKFATPEKLQGRAQKKARDILTKRLTKGKSKGELSLGQRQSIEKQLEKKQGAIKRIAKKLLPIIRKKDRAKFRATTPPPPSNMPNN